MKHYEIVCLVSPNLSLEEIKVFQEKIENFIQEEGGVFVGTKNKTTAIKRSLPYSIKTKFHPAIEIVYFIDLNFDLAPEKLEGIERKLKSENQILRYLILNKKALKAASPRKMFSKTLPAESKTEKIEKIKKEEVGLEKIEEKLDEILGDF